MVLKDGHFLLTKDIAYDNGILKITPNYLKEIEEDPKKYEKLMDFMDNYMKTEDEPRIDKTYEILKRIGKKIEKNESVEDEELEITNSLEPEKKIEKKRKELKAFEKVEENVSEDFVLKKYDKKNSYSILNPEKVSKAIAYKKGKDKKDWDEKARIFMDFFGYDDVIIDNKLEKEDRKLLYKMEKSGLVHTEKVKVSLGSLPGYKYSLKKWTSYFWVLEKDNIIDFAEKYDEENKTEKIAENIYDNDDFWASRTTKDSSL